MEMEVIDFSYIISYKDGKMEHFCEYYYLYFYFYTLLLLLSVLFLIFLLLINIDI